MEGLTTIRLELFLDASEQYAAVIPRPEDHAWLFEDHRVSDGEWFKVTSASWAGPLWDAGDGQELFFATLLN